MNLAGRKKWIFVDDNSVILDLYALMFRNTVPNPVVYFDHPLDALAAIREEPRAFEMLVTDWDMPVLDGVALLTHVRDLAPSLRFLVATGNPLGLEERLELFGLPQSIIGKPFGYDQLRQAIAQAPSLRGEIEWREASPESSDRFHLQAA